MVRNNLYKQKSAFTLIELIFAVFIIGISVLSLPMITQVTQKGMENSLLQEAVFAASAELMGASAGYWDANSMADFDVSHLSRVIDIGNDCDPTSRLRDGHINQPYHRRCLDDNGSVTSASNSAGGSFFTLNDANKTDENLTTNNITEAQGYKQAYTSSISVTHAGDIKYLESIVKDKDGEIIVRLRKQSANIGEIDYFKRTMP